MPELPEVEVICNFLRNKIKNKQISNLTVNRSDLRVPVTQNIDNILKNKIINDIKRRGKYIICQTNNRPLAEPVYDEKFLGEVQTSTTEYSDVFEERRQALTTKLPSKIELCKRSSDIALIIHLGMSGKLMYVDQNNVQNKHDHVIFLFSDDTAVIFNDPRRFGLIVALNQEQEINFFNNFGIEPLTDKFNGDYLQKLLRNKKVNIKSALMDSRLIVGIGNIYASESLFRARISPLRPAKDLNYRECKELATEIKNTLNDAITAGGSTLKDYVQPSGSVGYFQNSFHVYGKAQRPCDICSNIITLIRQNGRSTYFCNVCQN